MPKNRQHPVAFPTSTNLLPSDPMVIRRYKPLGTEDNPLKYFRSVLNDGYRVGKAIRYREDDPREGRASPPALGQERRQDNLDDTISTSDGSSIDYSGAMVDAREAGGHYNYPNCWRLGTDEHIEIWEEYADSIQGIAIETTIRQLRAHLAVDDQVHMGVVWYHQYDNQPTATFPFTSVYFFKDRKYQTEQEFRVLTNQGGNPLIWLPDGREGYPAELLPDSDDYIYLQGDQGQKEIINRIILAPYADKDSEMDIRAEVKKELNNAGFDVPVVSSRLSNGNSLSDTHDYAAELRGTKNYNASESQFNKIIDEWVSETDWSVWETLDIIQINQDGRNHPATTFLEAYRYKDDGPDWDIYGHEELHYEVRVHRFVENGLVFHKSNARAASTDRSVRQNSSRREYLRRKGVRWG